MAQKGFVSGSENPHVHLGLHVVLDADPTVSLHPDSLEIVTVFERFFA